KEASPGNPSPFPHKVFLFYFMMFVWMGVGGGGWEMGCGGRECVRIRVVRQASGIVSVEGGKDGMTLAREAVGGDVNSRARRGRGDFGRQILAGLAQKAGRKRVWETTRAVRVYAFGIPAAGSLLAGDAGGNRRVEVERAWVMRWGRPFQRASATGHGHFVATSR